MDKVKKVFYMSSDYLSKISNNSYKTELLSFMKARQVQQAVGPAEQPQYVGEPTSVTGPNLFAGNYEGVNENLGVGSQISYPTQAGVNRNGFTLCFA